MATATQRQEFLSRIVPLATADMKTTKILASLTIAQAILESGWGLSGLTKRSNNLFGIKGKGVASKTFEYINGKRVDITDNFKAYPDWETSVADHSGLFLRLPRYHNLIGETDYKEACRKVQADGYATAPNYAEVLIRLIEQYKLYQYDVQPKLKKYRVVFPYISTKGECESIIRWVQRNAKYTAIIEEEK
ncbi:MAG: mannosyl-glycoprotein endo-beta-N-acetylglucosamidase [Ruminococcus sp.]|nr:mannosyl-glycoprotein endo-beta-N-acetylglucosamidase [Ruminococcus sp.]